MLPTSLKQLRNAFIFRSDRRRFTYSHCAAVNPLRRSICADLVHSRIGAISLRSDDLDAVARQADPAFMAARQQCRADYSRVKSAHQKPSRSITSPIAIERGVGNIGPAGCCCVLGLIDGLLKDDIRIARLRASFNPIRQLQQERVEGDGKDRGGDYHLKRLLRQDPE